MVGRLRAPPTKYYMCAPTPHSPQFRHLLQDRGAGLSYADNGAFTSTAYLPRGCEAKSSSFFLAHVGHLRAPPVYVGRTTY